MNHSVRKLTDGAMMIAIVGVFLLIDRQLGGALSSMLMFLLPLPMVFYSAKYGMKDSWAVLVAMVLLSFIVSTPASIFYVASESFVGLLYGSGTKTHMPMRRLVLLTMLAGIFINIIDLVVIGAMLGYGLAENVTDMLSMVNQLFAQANVAVPANVDMTSFVTNIVFIGTALTGILQGLVTHLLSRLMLKRLRYPVEMPKPLGSYYPPKWSGYAGLAGFMVYYYTLVRPVSSAVVQNVYGCIAVILQVSLSRPKAKVLAGILTFFLIFSFPMFLLILGFLYITTDFHKRMLEGAGIHAEKDE